MAARTLIGFDEYCHKAKPVFIFGANRSGTTLMYHVLGFHPQVVKLPENTYFINHFWKVRRKIPVKAQLKLLLEPTLHQTPDQGCPVSAGALSVELLGLIKRSDPRLIFSYLSYIVYCRQADHDPDTACWWAERTNNHLFHYQTLKAWFPECKFIFCMRDPRAVIASELGAHRKNNVRLESVLNYAVVAALRWVRINSMACAIKQRFAGDILISRYEDMVAGPKRAIAAIWRYLGIAPMSEIEISEKIAALGPIYQSKVGVERSGGIDTKSVDQWRQHLSPIESAAIEEVTGATARHFGYVYEKRSGMGMSAYGTRQRPESRAAWLKRLFILPFIGIGSAALNRWLASAIDQASALRRRVTRRG